MKIEFNPADIKDSNNPMVVPVGISNHHVHLSQADLEVLFGEGAELHNIKDLSQPGQYAAAEQVTIVTPSGAQIPYVRVLGPVRKETQVEISLTESRMHGIGAPMRESGDLCGSACCKLVGPKGEVELPAGVITAQPHIHLQTKEAEEMGVVDKQTVDLYFEGEQKSGIIFNVLVRVNDNYKKDLHLDTDEANTFQLNNGDNVLIIRK